VTRSRAGVKLSADAFDYARNLKHRLVAVMLRRHFLYARSGGQHRLPRTSRVIMLSILSDVASLARRDAPRISSGRIRTRHCCCCVDLKQLASINTATRQMSGSTRSTHAATRRSRTPSVAMFNTLSTHFARRMRGHMRHLAHHAIVGEDEEDVGSDM